MMRQGARSTSNENAWIPQWAVECRNRQIPRISQILPESRSTLNFHTAGFRKDLWDSWDSAIPTSHSPLWDSRIFVWSRSGTLWEDAVQTSADHVVFSHTCMQMHTWIHTYTYIHSCMHTSIYMYTYICIRLCTYVHTYMYSYVYIHIHAYINPYIHTCMHVYYKYTYIHACIYTIHTHINKNKHACMYTYIQANTYIYKHATCMHRRKLVYSTFWCPPVCM